MLTHLRFGKYGVQTTFLFALEDITDAEAPFTGVAPLVGDIWLSKDGGAAANATNAFTAISNGFYSWVATAAEMQAATLSVNVYDATASAIFKPLAITIITQLKLGQLECDAGQLTNTSGIIATGVGTGDGIKATAGTTGNGLNCVGGATSGDGIKGTATAGNGNGLKGTGVGTGYGIANTAADTDHYNQLFQVTEGTEPAAAIASNATVMSIWQWVKRRFFNKTDVNANTLQIYKDDSATVVGTQAVSDDGTTDTIGKVS